MSLLTACQKDYKDKTLHERLHCVRDYLTRYRVKRVNRYCSSGLQTIAIAANQIMAGQGDILVAGGVELMSAVPMGGNEPTNNPTLI
ncbi:thiolase family protein [Staphylococcus aureus]